MAKRQLAVTIDDKGNLKINATKMPGTAKAILDELGELAALLGGDKDALKVEKHVHGAHTHTHDHDEQHTHG